MIFSDFKNNENKAILKDPTWIVLSYKLLSNKFTAMPIFQVFGKLDFFFLEWVWYKFNETTTNIRIFLSCDNKIK